MRKYYYSIIFTLLVCFISAQVKILDFSEGIYITFEDFENRTFSKHEGDYIVKVKKDSIAYRFQSKKDKKKTKNAFALFYQGNLYINANKVVENFDEESKEQAKDEGNYFLKAENVGDYIFLQDYFTSKEAVKNSGVTGAFASRGVKGVVYLEKEKQFKVFKNLNVFRDFIKENHPDYKMANVEASNREEEIKIIVKVLKDMGKQ